MSKIKNYLTEKYHATLNEKDLYEAEFEIDMSNLSTSFIKEHDLIDKGIFKENIKAYASSEEEAERKIQRAAVKLILNDAKFKDPNKRSSALVQFLLPWKSDSFKSAKKSMLNPGGYKIGSLTQNSIEKIKHSLHHTKETTEQSIPLTKEKLELYYKNAKISLAIWSAFFLSSFYLINQGLFNPNASNGWVNNFYLGAFFTLTIGGLSIFKTIKDMQFIKKSLNQTDKDSTNE